MRAPRRLAWIGLAACLALCGACGDSSNPLAPSNSPITALTVQSTTGQVLLGATENFSASVTRADGTTQTVTGVTWSSDTPSVAAVNASTGAVTGVASGTATIAIDYQNLRGTKAIVVRPNYAGTWVGSYTVNSCVPSGGWTTAPNDLCNNVLAPGAVLQDLLVILQNESSLTGQTQLGSGVVAFGGTTVQVSGRATINCTLTGGTTLVFESWSLNITTPGQLTGTLTQTWSDTSIAGQILAVTTLSTHARSAAAPSILRSVGLAGFGR